MCHFQLVGDPVDPILHCVMGKQLYSLVTSKGPKSKGFLTLERDLKDFIEMVKVPPSCINVTLNQWNDGSGISSTLVLNKAKYHKRCKSYCSSSRVKAALSDLLANQTHVPEGLNY